MRPAGVEVRAMSTLEQTEVLGLPAEHVGGGGKELDVVGVQRRGLVGGRQQPVRLQPCLGRMSVTSSFEVGQSSHTERLSPPPRGAQHRADRRGAE